MRRNGLSSASFSFTVYTFHHLCQHMNLVLEYDKVTLSMTVSSSCLRSNSPLFSRTKGRSSSTARHMVLTTPESIIEQASTQNLLDDLIDESVRTSARRPIMMQFDPSSGWVRCMFCCTSLACRFQCVLWRRLADSFFPLYADMATMEGYCLL